MVKRYSHFVKILHLSCDLMVLNLTFLLANLVSYGSVLPYFQWYFLGLINALWMALILIMRPYQISRMTQIIGVLRTQFNLLGLHFLMTAALAFFTSMIGMEQKQEIVTFYLILFSFSLPCKVALVFVMRKYHRLGYDYRKIAIVGYGKLSRELGSFLKQHPEYGYQLVGYFDDQEQNSQVLGTFDDIQSYSLSHDIDELYCCMPIVESKLASTLVDFGEENLITIKLITDFHEFSFKRMELEKYGGFPIINISSSPLDDFWNKLTKRIFDIAFSLVVLIFILSWLVPILALFIKLDSRGNVFFIQKRTGMGNRTFNCYKFRTMEEQKSDGIEQQILRKTRIGNFLRRYGIDELPQFLNVLLGDMSVIGPRPHHLRDTEQFKKLTDKFMFRHSIKPGITGLAQVKGYKGEIDSIQVIRNRVILDRFYIENWSLAFDIKITLLTISDLVMSPKPDNQTNLIKNKSI